MLYKAESAVYTGTGAQSPIAVGAGRQITAGVKAGASDVVDLEGQLVNGGTWYKIKTGLAANWLEKDCGVVRAVRLNITTNASGTVALEVVSAER